MRRVLGILALALAVAGCSSTITNPGTTASGHGTLSATLTATGASGTFSFVAPPGSTAPATGTKTVTNGKFNVTF